MIFGREPAFLIGLAGSIILAVAATLSGHDVITANQNQTIINVIAVLTPLITGIVTRFFVTPAVNPGL